MKSKQLNRTSASRGAGVAAKGNPRTTQSAVAVGCCTEPSIFFRGLEWMKVNGVMHLSLYFLLVWERKGKKTGKKSRYFPSQQCK